MLSSCVGLTRRDYNMMQISDFRTVMNCLHLRGQFNVAFTLADHPSNQSSRPVTAEFIQTTTSRLSGVNFPKFAKSGSKCPFCKEIFWWDSRAHGKRHPELCLIGAYGLTAHILHCPPPQQWRLYPPMKQNKSGKLSILAFQFRPRHNRPEANVGLHTKKIHFGDDVCNINGQNSSGGLLTDTSGLCSGLVADTVRRIISCSAYTTELSDD